MEIASSGFDRWYREYVERAELLSVALERYNNGRMKRFLCELFIQQEITVLREIMSQAEQLVGTPKENGKRFRQIVEAVLASQVQ